MKKLFTIKNIHCADCARSLEEVIREVKGVKFASINFITEKFELDLEEELVDFALNKIKKIISDFSKKVELIEVCENLGSEINKNYKLKYKIKGIENSQCIEKIKEALLKLKEVKAVDFLFGELDITLKEEPSPLIKNRIKSLIRTISPKSKVKEKLDHNKKIINFQYVFFAVGILLAVPIFLKEYSLINIPLAVYYSLLILSALSLGYGTYLTAFKMLLHLNINENLLVTISVFGAIIIGECAEGLMVISLYTLGKILEAKAVNKSRKSIQALLEISPDFAVVKRNGEEIKVDPKEVNVGATIIVKAGEKVPLDGEIIGGSSNINAQSLTGEAKPVYKSKGQEILAGVIVIDGVLEIKTTKLYSESTTTKIMKLIENASENKSKTETFISKFSKYYTLIVMALAVITSVATSIILKDVSTGIYRGLVFLVISCPCAFAISVPLTYFSGIGCASSKGILVKGSVFLDASAKTKVVAFDKTGTLTTGEFIISKIEIIEDIYNESEVLKIASVGEQYSIHPLSKCIVATMGDAELPPAEKYHEIAGLGIHYEYDGTEYFVGRDSDSCVSETEVVVKKGNIAIARIYFEDQTKTTSADVCAELKANKIKTVMLSGDSLEVAKEVSSKINMDECYGGLMPEDKYNWIQKTKQNLKSSETLIYVGDGLNDAPSLALADVGVSMGVHGSGASIEASDVVLVDDNPQKISELISIAKRTKRIVLQNILFASAIKLSCLILGTFGIAKMFMAVFADVGVTILAVLNSLRALNKK